ncbi:glycine cleavage system aminomethyltransferase GcvT [Xylanibacillus composti]|uniref:Aminomethyltransferase n=1 Tax=Xylanibacillus composti TaxID=1572762 RepID=A0A8J4M1K7_9BACL|nr:glycine cleavage system aminomethyltransferase GcvT [Xylanibacillus composti]GIQ68165.1 aminomethyltransferase [Xylanibacillus composti]
MLKKTPLHPVYARYGAKTIDFGGWELPVQFTGIMDEHHAVRSKAGLFDVSHMGEVEVSGKRAEAFLQQLTTNDVTKLEEGQAQYSLMCYPDGGVVDDLLIYKLAANHYMLVLNASNIDKDLDWLRKHAEPDVNLLDISEQTALLALQGPAAAAILSKVTNANAAELKPFRFVEQAEIRGVHALLSRTGYTGEDGFELYVPREDAVHVWELLLEAGQPEGIMPVGLGARDTLRFEAKLPLYGQELSASITPLEAGLLRFVKLDKGEFIGRDALLEQREQGVPRKLVGIEMLERGIPRSHYPVFAEDGKRIGEVTTGTHSPTLKKNVGLALVAREYSDLGQELWVEIRGKRLKALVAATPFYKRS